MNRVMKLIVVATIIVLGSLVSYGQTAKQLFEKGAEYSDVANFSEAIKCYKKAAEKGYAEAQYLLGDCYKNGLWVEQDSTEAVKWFRKAAGQGYEAAQDKLSKLGESW